ncbi:hypothetical protein ACHMW4_03875 [Mesorhizobium sp. UC22_110]|uniref:hypothetical protein n=1 Tax=unclassified Mesorhizobium TaxID=325217 RepID=UPI0036715933
MWPFLTSKLGVSVMCGLAITAFLGWTHYEIYETGRRYERQTVFTAALKAYKDRANENAAVEALDPVRLCVELGGLPDQCAAELRRLAEDRRPGTDGGLSRGQ